MMKHSKTVNVERMRGSDQEFAGCIARSLVRERLHTQAQFKLRSTATTAVSWTQARICLSDRSHHAQV
jgi:hypothetical protein